MDIDRLTEGEVIDLGRRLDEFARGLSPRERTFLTSLLRNSETLQHADIDNRTPGDIVVSIHRMRRSPDISLNPQPIPLSLISSPGACQSNE